MPDDNADDRQTAEDALASALAAGSDPLILRHKRDGNGWHVVEGTPDFEGRTANAEGWIDEHYGERDDAEDGDVLLVVKVRRALAFEKRTIETTSTTRIDANATTGDDSDAG